MRYKKYSIKIKAEAEDIVCAALCEAGVTSLEIEDSIPWTKQELDEIFVDEVPVNDIPEGLAYISFYLEENEDEKRLLAGAMAALEELKTYSDIGEGSISTSLTEDADWINKWKDFFSSFCIDIEGGKKMAVIPSWEDDDSYKDADIRLNIDPGTAFGTGAHETTRLCIKELSKYVKDGCRVLDLGTGSGILSMAALKLGAGNVRATDVDVNASPAVEDNFEKNGLKEADFRLYIGDVLSDEGLRKEIGGGYDILVANILPPVLIPLCGFIREFLKDGGTVIFSGILTEKKDPVVKALKEAGCRILSENEDGEWSSVTSLLGD